MIKTMMMMMMMIMMMMMMMMMIMMMMMMMMMMMIIMNDSTNDNHSLSQYLETGCLNRGFIDFCVYKVWYKVHTANKINPIYLQILLFRPVTAMCVL